jgi:hypothetical protein
MHLQEKLQRAEALSEERQALTVHMRDKLLSNELKFKQVIVQSGAWTVFHVWLSLQRRATWPPFLHHSTRAGGRARQDSRQPRAAC